MKKKKKVIIDTTIIFSALLNKGNEFRNILLLSDDYSFYTCRFLLVEIFKHKEKIVELSKLDENEILECLYELLKKIELYNERLILKENWKKAYRLCKDVDIMDISFIALNLELDGLLWTGDKKLKNGLKRKGYKNFF